MFIFYMLKLIAEGSDYCKPHEIPVYNRKIWQCDKCTLATLQEDDFLVQLVPYLGRFYLQGNPDAKKK